VFVQRAVHEAKQILADASEVRYWPKADIGRERLGVLVRQGDIKNVAVGKSTKLLHPHFPVRL